MVGAHPQDDTVPPAVEIRDLTKRYGRVTAVEGLDITVNRGEVYGLLGANGAGKTTTLRMLLGLIYPTSGTASVMGEPPGHPEGLAKIGSVVESPAFYPYLSGMCNLEVVARLCGLEDSRKRAREALERVGLAGSAGVRFKKYSLGMKQRLGVAAALLKDPELLILDEPTNGLDPQGMAEMRSLIQFLGESGKTVLLSSHLMGEVEQVCDRVGIISRGRLVAEGTVAELRGRGGLLVRAEPLEKALEVLSRVEGVEVARVNDSEILLIAGPEKAPEISRALFESGVSVSELRAQQRSLEEVFLELTGGEAFAKGQVLTCPPIVEKLSRRDSVPAMGGW